jgi:hypothetical protein
MHTLQASMASKPMPRVVLCLLLQVQQSQQLPAAPPTAAGSSTTTPFDVILLSIVRVTDDLSLAADGLVELTAAAAAATDPAAAGSTLEPDSFTLSSSSSSVAWQPLPVLHSAAAPALATGADDLGGQGTAQHSMSQQALTVAAEALRLATLLEGESDGCDPSEQELLQQIAAAARLVSIMAVDIIQPAGAQDAADPAASDPSSSNSVVAGEAAADAGSGAGVASFAGLAALGVRVSDLACAGPGADLAAGAPLPCLHL